MAEKDFVKIVADGLKEYCEEWGHKDRIEQIKNDSSVKNFRKLFFKVTHTYFVNDGDNCYDVYFDKKEDFAYVKKCGPDFDERHLDAILSFEDIIKTLVRGEE